MSIYIISDLHLCDQQPHISKMFINFCRNEAQNAQALYVLGDFFEYWLGDDALDNTARRVQQELKALSDKGIRIYFMAGNRDFLLGDLYAKSCGMEIIQEPHEIEHSGQKLLLLHGDAQCTDDVAYQTVRQQIRNPQWIEQFLGMEIEQRIAFAEQARKKSKEHTQNSDTDIMDVNDEAIQKLIDTHQPDMIIHGHTHRPAIHHKHSVKRIVLGDWHHQTSFLEITDNDIRLVCS